MRPSQEEVLLPARATGSPEKPRGAPAEEGGGTRGRGRAARVWAEFGWGLVAMYGRPLQLQGELGLGAGPRVGPVHEGLQSHLW